MLKVVKIGGNVVDNPDKLGDFLSGFARLDGEKILIHGGGKIASAISKSLGIEPVMVDGRRVTDARTLEVVTMVYAGLINKDIVNKLNAAGCRAVGLTGADGALIRSDRRPPDPVDYGYVGDPVAVDTGLLEMLLRGGYTPVIAPITTDGRGALLNTNADTVARTIAVAMAPKASVELVYCFEKDGVLSDTKDESSVIPEIDTRSYHRLRAEGIVSSGMIPKLDNAFRALGDGVSQVTVCSADRIASGTNGGTRIRK
ncbi:MAG: acetylglutamate kinase [Rikenellaceae bacterium]|nr:acetylglutamate kinase [Rikenellaceae bacterium]